MITHNSKWTYEEILMRELLVEWRIHHWYYKFKFLSNLLTSMIIYSCRYSKNISFFWWRTGISQFFFLGIFHFACKLYIRGKVQLRILVWYNDVEMLMDFEFKITKLHICYKKSPNRLQEVFSKITKTFMIAKLFNF